MCQNNEIAIESSKCSDEAQTSFVGSQISQAVTQFLFSEAQSQYSPVKIRFFVFNGWIRGVAAGDRRKITKMTIES